MSRTEKFRFAKFLSHGLRLFYWHACISRALSIPLRSIESHGLRPIMIKMLPHFCASTSVAAFLSLHGSCLACTSIQQVFPATVDFRLKLFDEMFVSFFEKMFESSLDTQEIFDRQFFLWFI